MKPITYYIQNDRIDQLVQRFGAELDLLDREQKLQLRIALTTFVWGHGQLGDDYDLDGAWFDSIEKIVERDAALDEVFAILEGLNIDEAEGLLEALQAQCRRGNARLKTAQETMTDTLVQRGVPQELAQTAANILTTVDGTRERTPEEQATINQLHQLVIKKAS